MDKNAKIVFLLLMLIENGENKGIKHYFEDATSTVLGLQAVKLITKINYGMEKF